MSKQEQVEQTASELKERIGDKTERFKERFSHRARHYADDALDSAQGLIERGRRATQNLKSEHRGDYVRHLAHYLEDAVDELGYRYRRVKRHAKRRPVATTLVIAGTVGAFLLLRRALRHDDE